MRMGAAFCDIYWAWLSVIRHARRADRTALARLGRAPTLAGRGYLAALHTPRP